MRAITKATLAIMTASMVEGAKVTLIPGINPDSIKIIIASNRTIARIVNRTIMAA